MYTYKIGLSSVVYVHNCAHAYVCMIHTYVSTYIRTYVCINVTTRQVLPTERSKYFNCTVNALSYMHIL